ncbi:putative transposase, partial [Colletotrichum incanum]
IQAQEAVASGISVRKTAQTYGIPYTTLQRRLTGAQFRAAAFSDFQRLSISQEAKLASWVQVQADLGLAPTHQQVREFAQRILHAMGDTQPLGKRWPYQPSNQPTDITLMRLVSSRVKVQMGWC